MTDELLNALKLIKKKCAECADCEDCPMVNINGGCGVNSDRPFDWNLKKREVYF